MKSMIAMLRTKPSTRTRTAADGIAKTSQKISQSMTAPPTREPQEA